MGRIFRRIFRCLVRLMLLAVALLILFRVRFRSDIVTLANTQIRNATSDLINDSIDRQIECGIINYDRIVYFEKDLDGRITALKTNMAEVNRLKTAILNMVNDEILALDSDSLSIPLGSLLLPEAFSGKGPKIPVEILSIRNSDGSFSSSFSEAGINQTRHQIIMEVLVDVSVLVMGDAHEFTVSSHMVIAETVIVGQVPDTLFQAGGSNGDTAENKIPE